jgi:hypothetical protein
MLKRVKKILRRCTYIQNIAQVSLSYGPMLQQKAHDKSYAELIKVLN